MAELTMERFLKWKILPRVMMAIMTYMYIHVLFWFMEIHDKGAVTPEATALTATVTGAMTGAFAVWLGHEK
jgi:Tfp pilus assembly protein PilO